MALSTQAERELLSFPMRHLGELPVPVRIALQVPGMHREILWDTAPSAAPVPGALRFDAGEVRALAVGVDSERLRPADFKGFCLRKLQDSSFRVTEQLALDGARPSPGPLCSVEQVMAWLDLEFVSLEWSDEPQEHPSVSPPIHVAA